MSQTGQLVVHSGGRVCSPGLWNWSQCICMTKDREEGALFPLWTLASPGGPLPGHGVERAARPSSRLQSSFLFVLLLHTGHSLALLIVPMKCWHMREEILTCSAHFCTPIPHTVPCTCRHRPLCPVTQCTVVDPRL